MKNLKPYLFPLLCLLAGLVFVGFGGYNLYAHFTFVPTEAVVTDVWYVDSGRADEAPSVHALVSYTAYDMEYEEELQNFATKDAEIGNVIRVVYNPNNPREVHGDKIVVPLVQAAFGSLFVAVGAIGLGRIKRERKHRSSEPRVRYNTSNY